MSEILVKMSKINKSFFGVKANNNIDFVLKKGEIHALLGENGAGKTTLMNILTGVYQQDSGSIEFDGKPLELDFPGQALQKGIGMVHQRLSLVGSLTILENIILGLPSNKFWLNMKERKELIMQYAKKFDFKLDWDARCDQVPIGVRQKAEILKMLVRDVEVLIVDEPTTVLTKQEADNLLDTFKKIAATGKGVIFITHKMPEVFKVADTITVMRKGDKIGTIATGEVEAKELSVMMVGEKEAIIFDRKQIDSDEDTIVVENLTVGQDVPLVDNVSFRIKKGEILGIAGVTGNGQHELMESIMGICPRKSGKIVFNDKNISDCTVKERIDAGISYIPSDRVNVGVAGNRPIWENSVSKVYRKNDYQKRRFLKIGKLKNYTDVNILEKYDVLHPGMNFPAILLSGGNLQKIIIGREIEAGSDLFICSYPTRGLDVGATDFVRKSLLDLRNQGKSVLLISSDFDELFGLADNLAVMYEGKFMGQFKNGAYDISEIGLMMSGTHQEDLDKQKELAND